VCFSRPPLIPAVAAGYPARSGSRVIEVPDTAASCTRSSIRVSALPPRRRDEATEGQGAGPLQRDVVPKRLCELGPAQDHVRWRVSSGPAEADGLTADALNESHGEEGVPDRIGAVIARRSRP